MTPSLAGSGLTTTLMSDGSRDCTPKPVLRQASPTPTKAITACLGACNFTKLRLVRGAFSHTIHLCVCAPTYIDEAGYQCDTLYIHQMAVACRVRIMKTFNQAGHTTRLFLGTVFNAASTFAFNFVYLLRFDPITRAAPIITNNGASHGIPKSATHTQISHSMKIKDSCNECANEKNKSDQAESMWIQCFTSSRELTRAIYF